MAPLWGNAADVKVVAIVVPSLLFTGKSVPAAATARTAKPRDPITTTFRVRTIVWVNIHGRFGCSSNIARLGNSKVRHDGMANERQTRRSQEGKTGDVLNVFASRIPKAEMI